MKVVVTGATGNVGTALLRALEADEQVREVVGIARRRPALRIGKVTWLEADVTHADLRPHFAGAGAVVHQNDLPPFKDRVPYVVAIVELEEGVRMTSNIEGIDPDDVRCDMPVEVAFREEQRDDETVALPIFRKA